MRGKLLPLRQIQQKETTHRAWLEYHSTSIFVSLSLFPNIWRSPHETIITKCQGIDISSLVFCSKCYSKKSKKEITKNVLFRFWRMSFRQKNIGSVVFTGFYLTSFVACQYMYVCRSESNLAIDFWPTSVEPIFLKCFTRVYCRWQYNFAPNDAC